MSDPSPELAPGQNNKQWRNYIQSVDVLVSRYWEPTTLHELVQILQDAKAKGEEVHAVGAGYSFENIAATSGWMVDLHNLGALIPDLLESEPGSRALTTDRRAAQFSTRPGRSNRLVHVQAGARLFDLCVALDRPVPARADRGLPATLALPTMGGALGQSVAGATSTSTHGSDIRLPPLCDLIQAVHLVTTGGREIWIESASRPVTGNDAALREVLQERPVNPEMRSYPNLQIIRDDDLLDAVIVGMGRFGVIYAVVLQVTAPSLRLAEFTKALLWADVAAALRAGGDATSGSSPFGALERQLPDPPLELEISGTARDYQYLDVTFNSRNGSVCWVRRRWPTLNTADLNLEPTADFLCHKGVSNLLLLAVAGHMKAHAALVASFPGLGLFEGPKIFTRAIELEARALNPDVTGGEALALVVNAVWASRVVIDHAEITGDALVHIVDGLIQNRFGEEFAKSEAQGKIGLNWHISAGINDPVTLGDCYRGNSIEIIFGLDARRHAPPGSRDYIAFIDKVLAEAGKHMQAGYIAVRFTHRSRGLLSMHNVDDEIACSIEITSLRGLSGNDAWMRWIEQTAVAMGGRPHWGQQNHLKAAQVEQLYGRDRLERWRAQLARVVGTSSTFSNDYTRKRGLEPARSTLVHASWVHGHCVEVEFPERIVKGVPFGFHYQLEGRAGSDNWVHFAIPTPVIADDQRLLVGPVMLRYRSVGGALVHAVHVYDGEKVIARHNGLNRQPNDWTFEHFDVPERPQVSWGLGISIGVKFPTAAARLEFASAGCDFYGWEF